METFETQKFETSSHSEDLDSIFNQDSDSFDEIFDENRDLGYECKVYFRLIRKKLKSLYKEKMQKNFTNILYLTLDCPPFTLDTLRDDSPLSYITKMQQQYPDKSIRVLIPLLGLDRDDIQRSKKLSVEIEGKVRVLEKTSVNFEFFIQNRVTEASIYKFPKNLSNIQVYGLFSPGFSFCKDPSMLSKIQFLSPFMKAARKAIRKLSLDKKENFAIDIIHCENIPFYLGSEFESKLPYPIKVLQTVKDFIQIDMIKTEPFWASINLADRHAMRRICRDNEIKKLIASLFKLHNREKFYQMSDCLRFIFKNYSKFRRYIDKGEDIEENIIFNLLNKRIVKIFPQLGFEGENHYNIMSYSLKRADFWVTTSKTYYKELFENPNLSGKMTRLINKTKVKSGYVSYGYSPETEGKVYQNFDIYNFREQRKKNKSTLLKEFNLERIKSNFIDISLFKHEDFRIYGSLDSFYRAPLIFANPNAEIFANGVDILFNSILKLFDLHKNIQVIIAINDGMKVNFIKSWVEFLEQNKHLNGRWVFIDGEINQPKFFAASDIILLPRRTNLTNAEHYCAMNYGCVPIVSRSGILNDSISDIFDDISYGCGFKTKTGLMTNSDNNELFLAPLMKALSIYQNNPASWNLLVKNCLTHDSSWSFKILEKYNKIYEEL